MKFILLVLMGITVSAAVANIKYSETELSNSQESLTNAIMTAIIEKCDSLETREAYYNCVADSVNKIIKTSVFPAPPIPWEQNPPREPGPDDVPNNYTINKEHPLVMIMPDYPGTNDDYRPSPDGGPYDRDRELRESPVREIPIGPDHSGSPSSEWPLL